MEARQKALLAATAAEDRKAHDVAILELAKVTLVADYFVVCSGNSRIQVKAIADHVEERIAEAGGRLRHREGYDQGRWVLLDFGDVVVHVFMDEDRNFYNLERLWGDAPRVTVSDMAASAP